MKLREVACGRSGDKGAHANIGIAAYTPEGYALIEETLTPERVAAHFAQLKPRRVKRYALPNLLAFNFVLEGVLEGGGNRSLRSDAQGKALAQALLEIEIG